MIAETKGESQEARFPRTRRSSWKASIDVRQAQDRLEQDLLNDVPLLYGSPGEVGFHDPRDGPGDPGIIIARIHREEMLRRNGVDAFSASGDRSEVRLPFERTVISLMFLLCAIDLLAKFA